MIILLPPNCDFKNYKKFVRRILMVFSSLIFELLAPQLPGNEVMKRSPYNLVIRSYFPINFETRSEIYVHCIMNGFVCWCLCGCAYVYEESVCI